MNVEVRADGLHISGYVNATGKRSRPVITPHGRCIEIIEERAFEQAIAKSGEITVTVDHDTGHTYATTKDGTLKVYEDHIGLHADVLITDEGLIETAKRGKIKGWSFGMYNVIDELEQRADDLPLRHVKSFILDHLALVVRKTPAYAATSVEVRADDEICHEYRTTDSKINLSVPEPPAPIDYSDYENRINSLKTAE